MLKVGVVGLGKMGISHLATLRAHPEVEIVGVCDSSSYVRGLLGRYADLPTFASYEELLSGPKIDAVVIATPTRSHASMVEAAVRKGLHVFCEKPLCLSGGEAKHLAELAESYGVVNQVGFHNRFVGSFAEVDRLLKAGAIGPVVHILGEAYGSVVTREQGATWRSRAGEGGGCLYEYAAHPINLMNWYVGLPTAVSGVLLQKIFSHDIEDSVQCSLKFAGEVTGQVSVNWSDESVRKMSTRVSIWGEEGKIVVDRQECRVYLRKATPALQEYDVGWNVRYVTELADSEWYYLRGEEYSAEIGDFVVRAIGKKLDGENTFASAACTDETIGMILEESEHQFGSGPVAPIVKTMTGGSRTVRAGVSLCRVLISRWQTYRK